MSRGAKVFDGTVDAALAKAGTQIRLQTAAENAQQWLSPLAKHITDEGNGIYYLTLNDNTDSQHVLKACIDSGAPLLRFEPEMPSLHDAFVSMVGKDNARGEETPS